MIEITHNRLTASHWVPQPIDKVFPFFSDPKNLERLTPPWLNFSIVRQSTPKIQEGTHIDYRLSLHGLPLIWKSEITEWEPGVRFADNQIQGPYRKWYHTHEFSSKEGGTLMNDRVDFKLPFGFLGNLALPWVKKDLMKIFTYRLKIIDQTFGNVKKHA